MMKLILSLTLIWTLSSTAEALQCWTGNVTNPVLKTCNSTHLCGSMATHVIENGMTSEFTQRWCLPSPPYTLGDHHYSHSLGSTVVAQFVRVCNKDGCNTGYIPYPGVLKKNNLQCFACEDRSSAVCDKTVQCVGEQDRCMNVTAGDEKGIAYHSFGCVSTNLCEALFYLEVWTKLPKLLSEPKCCGSSLCNSAWSVKLNVIPLLFGLITLIVY
ncbi:urokinase plasminogen activator surface receptor-like isoform X2 [Thunnus thynnus]|uniref:urokinase plasminogen activator surface receptor-like isoform X2 n=1 Tax=Thunnus thynnus TaxID=8237 RepID=UPI003527FC49